MAQPPSQHTPGPWSWDASGWSLRPGAPNPDAHAVHTIFGPEGCFGFTGSDLANVQAEDAANRHLIAAAPDLLNAARRLVDVASQGRLIDDYGDELALLRDAVRKAEGVL